MSLVFDEGTTSFNISVPIVDNNILENPENFNAVLSSTDPAAVLDPDTATVTITDNDGEYFRICTSCHSLRLILLTNHFKFE